MRAAAFVAVLSGSACACGEPTHLLVGGGGLSGPCARPGADPRCGNPCIADFDCGDDLYCRDGVCAADCTPGGECPGGDPCGEHGRCGGSGDAGPGPNDGGDDCPSVDVSLEGDIPTVALLLDESGSMDEPFAGTNRWDAMEAALVDPAAGVVTTLADRVRFGASLYTSHDGFDGGECPILDSVPIALDNHPAIQGLLAANGPDGDTPTGDAIDGLMATMPGPELDPRVILLATDGEPDTCEIANPQTGQAEAIAAAQRAFAAGVRLYILGVGSDVGAAHLQDMANAGAGLEVGGAENEPYYTANDPEELADALREIIGGVRTCTFGLSSRVDPERAGECEVLLNGVAIPFDDPDGWRLVDESTIELVGAACDTLLESADVRLTAECVCDAVII